MASNDRDPSGLFLRRALIAPLALAIVAFFHSSRVARHRQSPWKGGGFGMFSTVDTVGSRFLRAYVETPYGEIPVEIPAGLRKRAKQLRAAPDAQKALRLAKILAAQPWGHRDQLWTTLSSKIRPAANGPLSAQSLLEPPAEPGHWTAPTGQRSPLVVIGKAPGFAATTLKISAARVEVWKYEFDRSGTSVLASRGERPRVRGPRLTARRILESRFANAESQPSAVASALRQRPADSRQATASVFLSRRDTEAVTGFGK